MQAFRGVPSFQLYSSASPSPSRRDDSRAAHQAKSHLQRLNYDKIYHVLHQSNAETKYIQLWGFAGGHPGRLGLYRSAVLVYKCGRADTMHALFTSLWSYVKMVLVIALMILAAWLPMQVKQSGFDLSNVIPASTIL